MNSLETELNLCEKILNIDIQTVRSYPKDKENTRIIKLQDDLNEIKSDLDDQLKRFKKKNFEIAVVGREKAGKSSLLNAWIGFELLPSDRNRCTYTTTEIRSCVDISEQKYLIEYLSTEDFEKNYNNIVNSHASKELQQKEFDEIHEKHDEIKSHLNKGSVVKLFQDFDEVKEELKSAISEVGHARAVKNICIWTPKISNTEHVVFYDVPGYDSPITLHKEQTKAKIASVDAVVYAKKFIEPDLVDCELEILKISDLNDPYLKASDKIVVALTNCDQATSAKDFRNLISSNCRAWQAFSINESRVIPVCSLVELKGNLSEGFKAKNDLESLNNGDTGFATLREAVNKLVADSRNNIARERCNQIKNKIRDFSTSLCNLIRADFSIDTNTEIKDTLEDNEMNRIYNEWWAQFWQRLKEEFQIFYNNEIRPKSTESGVEENTSFKELYDRLVDKTIKGIPSTKKNRQEELYPLSIGDDGVDNPKKANTLIRDELSLDSINSLDKITVELNGFLSNKVNKIIDWIRNKLWNLPEIRATMIGSNEEMENLLLKKSFDALIQRLARPATNIFLKYPRSRIERCKVLQEYQMEIIIINTFMIHGRVSQRGIVHFLANGKLGNFELEQKPFEIDNDMFDTEDKTLSISKFYVKPADSDTESLNSVKVKSRLGFISKSRFKLKKTTNKSFDNLTESGRSSPPSLNDQKYSNNQFEQLKFSKDSETLAEIQLEIEQDVEEFITCMKNSIYYGSGIQRFLYQELDKIRRKFFYIEDAKRGWWSIIDNHLKDKNSTIKIPAPKMADEIAKRSKMIKNFRAIKLLLKDL